LRIETETRAEETDQRDGNGGEERALNYSEKNREPKER
jgi:hypothetical protein